MALLTKELKEHDIVVQPNIRKKAFDKGWVVNGRPPANQSKQIQKNDITYVCQNRNSG